MTCDCLETMQQQLKAHNTEIVVTFGFPRDGSPSYMLPKIDTAKLIGRQRGKSVLVLPTFCPFCGTRYQQLKDPE